MSELGKVELRETPGGAAVHVFQTHRGHVVVGRDSSGGDLTVVVTGHPTNTEMTWGSFFDAVAEGGELLNKWIVGAKEEMGCMQQNQSITLPDGTVFQSSQSTCSKT